jgi:Na+(H+)/acetate symporter ActP
MTDSAAEPAPEQVPEQVPTNTERSPRRGMAAAVLSLEAITLGLTTPVMITIADVPAGTAVTVGLGLAVVCLLLAGMLRAEWAYVAGYVVQVAAVALGFVVPVMFVLGAIFAALWTAADLLGRKIERERAAAWAAYRAEQG